LGCPFRVVWFDDDGHFVDSAAINFLRWIKDEAQESVEYFDVALEGSWVGFVMCKAADRPVPVSVSAR